MGYLFSKPINSWVLHHLRSLHKDGNAHYKLKEFETEFPLSTFLGREDAPNGHMFIANVSVHCRDLQFDGQPLRIKSSKITITIGKLVVRCDDLGYKFRIKGRITFFDVLIKATFNLTFEHGIKVSDIGAEVTVKKIKGSGAVCRDTGLEPDKKLRLVETQIRFGINGTDHSHLANTLLSIDNPQVASNLLNAVFFILKEDIKISLNESIKEVASQQGL